MTAPIPRPLGPTRRRFTDAARAAALAARQKKREEASPLGTPEVYVVRALEGHQRFSWEIRRFGGVIIERSVAGYENARAARSAGREALVRSGGGA